MAELVEVMAASHGPLIQRDWHAVTPAHKQRLTAAFEALGGVIHEGTPVVRVEDVAGRPVVRTPQGVVRPEVLILAGNAYLGAVVPEIADRVMPFSTRTSPKVVP